MKKQLEQNTIFAVSFSLSLSFSILSILSPYKYANYCKTVKAQYFWKKHQSNISAVSRYKLGRWPSNVCDHVGGNVWQVCLGVPALCDIVCDTSVSWGPNTVTFCHGFRLRHAAIRSSQCHSVEPQPPHAYDKLCTRPCVRVNNTVIAPWQDNRDSVIIPTTLNVIIYVIAGRSVINALVWKWRWLGPWWQWRWLEACWW